LFLLQLSRMSTDFYKFWHSDTLINFQEYEMYCPPCLMCVLTLPWYRGSRFYVWKTASHLGFKSSRFSFNVPKLLVVTQQSVRNELAAKVYSVLLFPAPALWLSNAACQPLPFKVPHSSDASCPAATVYVHCVPKKNIFSLTLASPRYVNSFNENFHILQYNICLV